jgi:hypothetical protein
VLLRDAEFEDRVVALENQAQFPAVGRADRATIARRPRGSSGDAFGGNHGVCLFASQAACKLGTATNSVRLAYLFVPVLDRYCCFRGAHLVVAKARNLGLSSVSNYRIIHS